MQIFAPDDPLVLNGTYNTEGYKPGERERIARAKARMAKTTRKKVTTPTRRGRPRALIAREAQRSTRPKRPHQPSLPGTQSTANRDIDRAAQAYANARDERMQLTTVEHDRKAEVLAKMKRHGLTHYQRNGIVIDVVAGEDDVKVRVKPADDLDAPDDGGDGAEVEQPEPEGNDAADEAQSL